MILHIDDSITIADVQDKFSRCFPALKIEFFKKPHHFKEASPTDLWIYTNVALSAIRKIHSPQDLTITSSDQAGEVEMKFKKIFGLNVQVFRKENNSWIQTGRTDTYTLKELSDLSTHSSY